ncbi:MAG: hypothetical protein IKS49_05575 [Actinomycetaceae bacterium]|nr:hypothetical protein [Actinomycetaceae bacterium]
MPTSTDPYNSADRLVEADDVLEPLGAEAVPEVASSAQEAAIAAADASATDMAHNVQGSLSLDEKPVEVTQVSDADVFTESGDLSEEGNAAVDALVSSEDSLAVSDLPERPEATLADGPAYAPSPSAIRSSASAAEAPSTAVPGLSVNDNADWAEQESIETLPEGPKSRLKAHIGIFFATILLVPIAWYLFSDASIRLAVVENNPWATGKVSILALLETVGALVVLGLIWFLARASSLGAFCSGLVVTILGAVGVVVPFFARETIANGLTDAIGSFNSLTGNIAHHFAIDLGSGRILFYGFLLLMTGIVSHYARKRGTIAGKQIARRDMALGK